MRPALKAGLLPLWRDPDTLQLGVDPRRAVAVGGLGAAAGVISLLDGSRDRESLIAAARDHGIPAEVTSQVLAVLAAAGAVLSGLLVATAAYLVPVLPLAALVVTLALAWTPPSDPAR